MQNAQHSGPVSTLSADAASFVPCQPVTRHGHQGSASQQGGGANSGNVVELPRYMTSCYPFVQGDPGPALRVNAVQSGEKCVAAERLLILQPGALARLRCAMVSRDLRMPPYAACVPAVTFIPPGAVRPLLPFPHCQPPPVWPPIPPIYPQCLPMQLPPCTASDRVKKKLEPGGMVSVGIQSDSGTRCHGGGGDGGGAQQRHKSSPTTICVDTATQTDFSESIACLTLLQRGSSLYNPAALAFSRSLRSRAVDSSTDSDEVHSDSGYSSPLHRRRKQAAAAAAHVSFVSYPAPLPPPPLSPFNIMLDPTLMMNAYRLYMSGGYTHVGGVGGGGGYVNSYPGQYPAPVHHPMAPPSVQKVVESVTTSATTSVTTSVTASVTTASVTASCETRHGEVDTAPMRTVGVGVSGGGGGEGERSGVKEASPGGDEPGGGALKKKRRHRNRKKKKSCPDSPQTAAPLPATPAAGESSSLRGGEEVTAAATTVTTTATMVTTTANTVTTTANTLPTTATTVTAAPSVEAGVVSGVLHFADVDDFPDLLASCTEGRGRSARQMNYSDIVKTTHPTTTGSSRDSSVSSTNRLSRGAAPTTSGRLGESRSTVPGLQDTKVVRKRQKRLQLANQAAEDEMAEISIELQVLHELHSKASYSDPLPSTAVVTQMAPPAPVCLPKQMGPKSRQLISLNIADMITALERKQEEEKILCQDAEKSGEEEERDAVPLPAPARPAPVRKIANPLDATAPAKRGKEREIPKLKKPSQLKKVILKEREERKRLRLLDDTQDPAPLSPPTAAADDDGDDDDDDDDCEEEEDDNNDEEEEEEDGTNAGGVAEFVESSQEGLSIKETGVGGMSVDMSPISQTSPISMSPLSGSPLSAGVQATDGASDSVDPSVMLKIHSRRFREYCNQVLNKEIDGCCTNLLQDLVRFQDRLFHKDPLKAKKKRRIVLGLREVTKHLKLKKIKCVIISPNLERIRSKGGLDEALDKIMQLCAEQMVPFVFALGRRSLGRACAKLVPVSVVGIFNFEGSETYFQQLVELMEGARSAYVDMVSVLARHEACQKDVAAGAAVAVSLQQLFPHLSGHSRTPSACSAISFTSSILSEPISENYPYSEPETDSRGYEILRRAGVEEAEGDKEGNKEGEGPLHEIDEGHEADTEDDQAELAPPRALTPPPPPTPTPPPTPPRTPPPDLPHIDSIHASALDLAAEILSQHSAKTIDDAAAATAATADVSNPSGGAANTAAATATQKQSPRLIDKHCIESWVAATQRQIDRMDIGAGDKLAVGGTRLALTGGFTVKSVIGSEAVCGDAETHNYAVLLGTVTATECSDVQPA